MSSARVGAPDSPRVDLYWLPLGAGDGSGCVRWNGRAFEALVARHEHRTALDLYHSALEVRLGSDRFVIEMVPAWSDTPADRGVVCQGPVGLSWLGRSRFFRYEVRCWRGGVIPDVSNAVDSPMRLSSNVGHAERLLGLVPAFPTATWGRDELRTGEMWNSNSLIAWLLACSGHDTSAVGPPAHGRAPGWSAGSVVAARQEKAARAIGGGQTDRLAVAGGPPSPGADTPS
jgi:hypothetical protein